MTEISKIEEQALAYEMRSDAAAGIDFCLKHLQDFPESIELNIVAANLYGDIAKPQAGLPFAEKALSIDSNNLRARVALAYLLNLDNQPAKALEVLEHAAPAEQEDANYLLQRSLVYRNTGQSRQALGDLQKVLTKHPTLAEARSNYLLFLHDLPGVNPEAIFSAHENYQKYCAQSLPQYSNFPAVSEKINLGFVSSDLRRHSVTYFLLPLLENIDRERFTINLYSNNTHNDEVTEKLKNIADNFENIRNLTDEQACELIRSGNINVLFDLNGHTSGNRLGIFARKPVKTQINWLGYPDTTGLESIDYRIVDSVSDPVDCSLSSETLKRIPGSFLCYQPAQDTPEPSVPPFEKNGFITFGSYNNIAKTTPELLDLWGNILKRCQGSHLRLKSPAFNETTTRKRILHALDKHDIEHERIIFAPRDISHTQHLMSYNQIDIALDTFPYNGTTTTFEALYMGVPVITLKGQTHAQRVGASILMRLDLDPLIASSAADYYNVAIALANQHQDIKALRASLRGKLLKSSLCDGAGFARKIMVILKEFCK